MSCPSSACSIANSGSNGDVGGDGDDCDDGDAHDSSEGTGGIPARKARGQCPSHLLNTYLTRGGCCKDSCLMKYGDLSRRRALTVSRLDKKTRKAVMFGMLAVIWDKSGSRNTFQYCLDWSSPVCRDAFYAVIGTSYCTLKRWMQQVRGRLASRTRKNVNKSWHQNEFSFVHNTSITFYTTFCFSRIQNIKLVLITKALTF